MTWAPEMRWFCHVFRKISSTWSNRPSKWASKGMCGKLTLIHVGSHVSSAQSTVMPRACLEPRLAAQYMLGTRMAGCRDVTWWVTFLGGFLAQYVF